MVFSANVFCAETRGMQYVASTSDDITLGDFYLLAIGIDDYIEWPKLKTAVNDAKEISDVLRNRYSFDHIETLYNFEATEKNIIASLRSLARKLKHDDSLLVFYAGHGHLDDLTKSGSWIPVDASRTDASTWIDNDEIKKIIKSMKARHVLLISDSCFAGDFFRGARGKTPVITEEYINQAFGKTSRQAITSGGLEPVSDAGFEEHSVFSHFLLKQLHENSEPYLLPVDLHNRIKGGVSANARQHPVLGDLDGTGGEIGGEFVLFLKGIEGTLEEAVRRKKERIEYLEHLSEEERKKEEERQVVLAEKEAQMKALDARIADMQKKLAPDIVSDGTLDELYAMAVQKEKQAAELEILRKEAEEERQRKEAEIARMKAENLAKKKSEFDADYAKFLKIYNSQYMSDPVKTKAWVALCDSWGLKGRDKEIQALTWNNEKEVVAFSNPEHLALDLGSGVKMEFVWIDALKCWVGKYEVTNGEYRRFAPDHDSGKYEGHSLNGDRQPVVNVSYDDAVAYADWINKKYSEQLPKGCKVRLPGGKEWLTYAQCGDGRGYPWGDDWPPKSGQVGNYWEAENYKDGYLTTCPVEKSWANEWGLYGVGGNVWEWTSELYARDKDWRVLRGASWDDFYQGNLRCSSRVSGPPSYRSSNVGFRLLLSSRSSDAEG